MFFQLFRKPQSIKIIREEEDDIRISTSNRYEKYRVEYDPSGDFSYSVFSQLDIDEMTRSQCFSVGTILVDMRSGERFEVSGGYGQRKSKNDKAVKESQYLRSL